MESANLFTNIAHDSFRVITKDVDFNSCGNLRATCKEFWGQTLAIGKELYELETKLGQAAYKKGHIQFLFRQFSYSRPLCTTREFESVCDLLPDKVVPFGIAATVFCCCVTGFGFGTPTCFGLILPESAGCLFDLGWKSLSAAASGTFASSAGYLVHDQCKESGYRAIQAETETLEGEFKTFKISQTNRFSGDSISNSTLSKIQSQANENTKLL